MGDILADIKLSDCIAPNFYDLHEAIKAELVREIVTRGGRGSTKSSFDSIEIILGLEKDEEANAVAFRRYENEIRDSVHSQLEWAVAKLGVSHLWDFYTSPLYAQRRGTEQRILFKGADKPGKTKSAKIKKGYVKFLWFEEVDQFGGMGEIRTIKQSFIRGTNKHQITMLSYNPPKSARSWINTESKIKKPGRITHYSDYRGVPREWLGEAFFEDAEYLKKTNLDAYKHEYLGEEIGTGLEVFNNVTLRTITVDEKIYFDNIYQGLDFGYAADPLCFEQMHYDQKKNRLYFFAEISGHGIKNREFADMLSDVQKAELTMGDSAEPKSIDELKQDHGVSIMGAEKGPGSVDHGIKWLQDLEEIIIDPEACPLAAKEFVNYALDVNRQGDVISKYPDKDNHSIDTARYGMNRAIKQARVEKNKKPVNITVKPIVNRWG